MPLPLEILVIDPDTAVPMPVSPAEKQAIMTLRSDKTQKWCDAMDRAEAAEAKTRHWADKWAAESNMVVALQKELKLTQESNAALHERVEAQRVLEQASSRQAETIRKYQEKIQVLEAQVKVLGSPPGSPSYSKRKELLLDVLGNQSPDVRARCLLEIAMELGVEAKLRTLVPAESPFDEAVLEDQTFRRTRARLLSSLREKFLPENAAYALVKMAAEIGVEDRLIPQLGTYRAVCRARQPSAPRWKGFNEAKDIVLAEVKQWHPNNRRTFVSELSAALCPEESK